MEFAWNEKGGEGLFSSVVLCANVQLGSNELAVGYVE